MKSSTKASKVKLPQEGCRHGHRYDEGHEFLVKRQWRRGRWHYYRQCLTCKRERERGRAKEREAKGLCQRCAKNKPWQDRKHCRACLLKLAAGEKRRYDARKVERRKTR